MTRTEDTAELARLRSSVRAFVRAFGLLSADRTPCGAPIPLSHAYALVHLLEASRADVEPTQQDLVRALRIDKSNVARLCAKLERDGCVVQRRAEHDGRARCLRLTAKGRRLAARVEASSRARFAQLLQAVPAASRPTLLPAIEALAAAAATINEVSA